MPSSEKTLIVSGVSKSFGDVAALRNISFEVSRGEVLGLLGPNGAGKTTMLDVLSTPTRPDRGHARVAGHDVVFTPGQGAPVDHAHGPAGGRRQLLTGRRI